MLSGPLEALAVAFGVVFLAELGDKTQLMVLAFAARYRALPVIIGVVAATAVVMAASVFVGAALGSFVEVALLQLVGGIVFLLFAAWTLVSGDEEEEEEAETVASDRPEPRSGVRAAALVGGTFVLSELGDKSMLAAMALAAQAEPIATWAGATLGEVAVSLIAIAVGRQLGARIPSRWLRLVAAPAFAVFGALLLWDAFSG